MLRVGILGVQLGVICIEDGEAGDRTSARAAGPPTAAACAAAVAEPPAPASVDAEAPCARDPVGLQSMFGSSEISSRGSVLLFAQVRSSLAANINSLW